MATSPGVAPATGPGNVFVGLMIGLPISLLLWTLILVVCRLLLFG